MSKSQYLLLRFENRRQSFKPVCDKFKWAEYAGKNPVFTAY